MTLTRAKMKIFWPVDCHLRTPVLKTMQKTYVGHIRHIKKCCNFFKINKRFSLVNIRSHLDKHF